MDDNDLKLIDLLHSSHAVSARITDLLLQQDEAGRLRARTTLRETMTRFVYVAALRRDESIIAPWVTPAEPPSVQLPFTDRVHEIAKAAEKTADRIIAARANTEAQRRMSWDGHDDQPINVPASAEPDLLKETQSRTAVEAAKTRVAFRSDGRIPMIVLTGGPCGGKTTALIRVRERLEALGYRVYVAAETATHLIMGGLEPSTMSPEAYVKFQAGIAVVQKAVETAYVGQAAKETRCVILLDRGTTDGAGFTSAAQWNEVCKLANIPTLDQSYTAVIHLVTAANGAADYYTRDNNPARKESSIQAIAVDQSIQDAWTGHPHLRVIDNSTDFEGKLTRVMKEIMIVLGEPEPEEAERKFLVRVKFEQTVIGDDELWPTILARKIHIHQWYLPGEKKGDPTRRLRKRQLANSPTDPPLFTLTIKGQEIRPGVRPERERQLDEEEFHELLHQHDLNTVPFVTKTRWCAVWEGRYWELDVFPEGWIGSADMALLELETDEEGQVELPPFVEQLKEVTGNATYSNEMIAERNHYRFIDHPNAIPAPTVS